MTASSRPNKYLTLNMQETMKKILVIGSGGAGKSTFARRLSKILDLEIIHLDALYWQSGWVEMPKPEWKHLVQELVKRDSWIMDGNYSGTLELRMQACDTVIFLDLPPHICLWRIFKRSIRYRNRRRPDMAEGCPERLSFEFISWVWNYRNRSRPKVVRLLGEHSQNKKIIRLRSNTEVENFFAAVRDR
jgi:adenylate kinase family enzyme